MQVLIEGLQNFDFTILCYLWSKKEISQVETVSTSFEPETLWNEKFKYLAKSKFILVCLLSYAFVQNKQ